MFVVSQKVERCDVKYFLAWNELKVIIIIITMRNYGHGLEVVGSCRRTLALASLTVPNTLFDRGERKWRQKKYAVQENSEKKKEQKNAKIT